VGEATALLRTNWEMSLTYSSKDNLWSISERRCREEKGKSCVFFSADQSAFLISLCCGSFVLKSWWLRTNISRNTSVSSLFCPSWGFSFSVNTKVSAALRVGLHLVEEKPLFGSTTWNNCHDCKSCGNRDNTWVRGDMEFLFECPTGYLTRERSELVISNTREKLS